MNKIPLRKNFYHQKYVPTRIFDFMNKYTTTVTNKYIDIDLRKLKRIRFFYKGQCIYRLSFLHIVLIY
jgi:hypothetical protein